MFTLYSSLSGIPGSLCRSGICELDNQSPRVVWIPKITNKQTNILLINRRLHILQVLLKAISNQREHDLWVSPSKGQLVSRRHLVQLLSVLNSTTWDLMLFYSFSLYCLLPFRFLAFNLTRCIKFNYISIKLFRVFMDRQKWSHSISICPHACWHL